MYHSQATNGAEAPSDALYTQVRIYEVGPSGQTQGKAMYTHEGPVLDLCWNGRDGSKLFSVGADKAARVFDVSTGQNSQVGVHDAPIKCARWFESPTGGILATGSWDKTVKVRLHPLRILERLSAHILKFWFAIVLGFEEPQSCIHSSDAREGVHHGCTISSNGCGHCGKAYPNIEPQQSHDSL